MRKRYAALGIASVLLVLGSTGYVARGMQLYHQYHAEFTNYNLPCGTFITWSPPGVLFTGLYVNQPGLLTLRYRSPQPQTLRITVSIPQFTMPQSLELQAAPAFQNQTFKPPLLSDSVLDALVGPGERRAQIQLQVQTASGDLICNTTAPLLLKSRQWMRWHDPTLGIDNTPYLAGWVTPDTEAIHTLIGRTSHWLQAHPGVYPHVSSLFGYNLGQATPDQVREQVDAIFDTLQNVYHVTYANDNIPFSTDSEQIIQLPQDILSSSYPTGMCVETTAIMASAVEALGMRPYFIIIPGHAFLGVALGADHASPIDYWETSDLNGTAVHGDQANIDGKAEYAQAFSKGQIVEVVDVQFEREQGIIPIE